MRLFGEGSSLGVSKFCAKSSAWGMLLCERLEEKVLALCASIQAVMRLAESYFQAGVWGRQSCLGEPVLMLLHKSTPVHMR